MAAFRFRMATEADIRRCIELLPDGLDLRPEIRSRLPELWERLLRLDARTFSVIEDRASAPPAAIEAFGLSVVVSDDFVEQILGSSRPGLPAAFYDRFLARGDVVLTPRQLAEANAGDGVNVVVLHFGLLDRDPAVPRTAEALAVGTAAFYFFHAGYRIKWLAQETYGPAFAAFVRAGGFRILRDYQQEAPSSFAGFDPRHYPYLTGLGRDDVVLGAVNPLSQLFYPQAPHLGLARAERHLLEHALLNESDAEIARSLGVTENTVKKTWATIYERVGRSAPFLVPPVPSSGLRGQEKRRRLLDYVRMHLEELRPYAPPARHVS